jgi:hypothetical protein
MPAAMAAACRALVEPWDGSLMSVLGLGSVGASGVELEAGGEDEVDGEGMRGFSQVVSCVTVL